MDCSTSYLWCIVKIINRFFFSGKASGFDLIPKMDTFLENEEREASNDYSLLNVKKRDVNG